MNYHPFRTYILTLKSLNTLCKMFETVDRLGISDPETHALVLEKYIRTESMWEEMRQETDYDDLH